MESGDAGLRVCATGVLRLLQLLREHSDEKTVFALTSMHRLCLLAEDDPDSPWYVMVEALSGTSFEVYALMPENQGPWANAYAFRLFCSVDATLAALVEAIEYTQGWDPTDEG